MFLGYAVIDLMRAGFTLEEMMGKGPTEKELLDARDMLTSEQRKSSMMKRRTTFKKPARLSVFGEGSHGSSRKNSARVKPLVQAVVATRRLGLGRQ